MDYIAAVWFFLLTLAGVICLVPSRMARQPGWMPLGFTLLMTALMRLGPLIWCSRISLQWIIPVPFTGIILTAVFAFFAARKFSKDKLPSIVVLLPVVLGAILCWSVEPRDLVHQSKWIIWAPSLGTLACTLFVASRKFVGEGRVGGYLIAVGCALLAAINPIPNVYGFIASSLLLKGDVVPPQEHLLWIVISTIASACLLVGTWLCFRQRRVAEMEMDQKSAWRGIALIVLLLAILLGGWFFVEYASKRADQSWRDTVSNDAELVAAACGSSAFLQQLSGTKADTKLSAYTSLKERLSQVVKTSNGYHFAYLLTMKDNKIIFLLDSEPRGSKDESVAGDIYSDADAKLYPAFYNPHAFVVGPYTDQWGTWISGYAPIPGNSMNGLPIYIGLDKSTVEWSKKLARLRQEKMLLVMALELLVTGLFVINYLTAESRIRQAASEERLRLSLQGANLISWEMDLQAQTIAFDQQTEKRQEAFDLPPLLSAQEFLTLVHPDDWESVKNVFTEYFRGAKRTIVTEFRLRTTDGSFLWVISRGQITHQDDASGKQRAAGLILDISDRKKNELELARRREEATRLALVAESTTSAVIITSPAGLIEWTNAAFTGMTGYSSEEVIGRKPGDFLQGKETDSKSVNQIKNALSNGRGFEVTMLNYHKNGIPYWVAIECQPLRDEHGELSGYMAIETDVTRRVEAEKALGDQRHRLQQINLTLLGLGDSYENNIQDLTDLAARVLNADRALYGRLEKDHVVIHGKVGLPEGYPVSMPASQSLYAEVIQGGQHFLRVRNPLSQGKDDPGLEDFKTYIGEGVHLNGQIVGSLNLLYKGAFELTEDLHDCLIIIAQAIGKEELLSLNRHELESLSLLEVTERSRFSTLLKNIDDAVLVEDTSGKITYANPAFEKMFQVAFPMIFGISCEVILRKASPYFLHPERMLFDTDKVLHEGKTVLNQIYEMVDGRYLARDFFPIWNEGVLHGTMWRYRDVTRAKKHQLLLEAISDVGQLVLNTPLNSSSAWLALVTLLGKKIGLDRVRLGRYQLAPDGSFKESRVFAEWDKKKDRSFYRNDGNNEKNTITVQPNAWMNQFLKGRSVYEINEEITAPFLKELGTKSFLCIPLTVEGELWGTMGFHYSRGAYAWEEEEITLLETVASLISSRLDLQHSEKALLEAKNLADAANRAKSTFLATMSHEIRTPLNAVIGVSSLLMETKLEPQQRDYAATVSSSGEILLELINDILDYSKIEASKIDLEQRPFPLVDVLVEPLEILARPAAEKKIELFYSMDPSLHPVVIGDRVRLKQVILNLVSNAVKFTEHGSVTVRAEPGEEGCIQLTVQDTGIGMDEEVQSRLFIPFMQADSSVTRKYGGTGLGLAISKRLVELMEGKISVKSEQGKGTTFSIQMPLPVGRADSKSVPAPDDSLIEKKVLIVDDHLANRKFLRDQLHVWGMISVEVESGEQALALLTPNHEFALALLDYQMPDLDGLDLARCIKQSKEGKDLPLILLSSVIERVPKEDEMLFSAALTKPLRIPQLLEAISFALGAGKIALPEIADSKLAHAIKVLVAEDNLTNQKVITMMFSRLGITPLVVEDGLQALEAVKNNTFDLALIDIQMPVMDGLETARQMRQYFGTAQRPEIIALTANAFKEDREACLAAGMDSYLVKPITLDRLRAVVDKIKAGVSRDESV